MAVGKALDLSNPLIASRISLERTLDTFSRVFSSAPAASVRARLKDFSWPGSFTAAAAAPAEIKADTPASSDEKPSAAESIEVKLAEEK